MEASGPLADRASAYLQTVTDRLVADACDVRTEDWGGWPVVVGRRSDFRLRWMATRMHLVTVLAISAGVTAPVIESFSAQVSEYAKRGRALGLQSGVAAFPVLISPSVDDAALQWAAEKQRLQFACLTRPVVVDTSRGIVAAFRGTTMIGRLYSGHLQQKMAAYFPPLPPVAALDPQA